MKATKGLKNEVDINRSFKSQFQRYNIFLKRPMLFLWLIINILMLFGNIAVINVALAFFASIFLYFIIVNLALSNTAEKVMRAFNDMRRVATQTEKERLLPIFSEVYNTAKENNNYISNNIKLYIVDEMGVNAHCLGNNTIAVTRGLMETMTDDEIKGILAHEFAHNVFGDSQLQILLSIGTSIYLWLFLVLKAVLRVFEGNQESGIMKSVISFVRFIVEFAIHIFLLIWTVILCGSSKKKEYRADKFAYDMGYGENLLAALYKLYHMQISDKRKLIDRVQIGHPRTAYRIEKLEALLTTEKN